ncbi:alpha/beta fold hydrolase [Kribbella sp. CA-293567]|uniref:alpha/beta fold hydrolase n=1 Tax=Kribbella sp. CA-293567 TaxID=3002436 RepID=UPI0022DD4166|nr:alpha/beta hydrolase [Kribbella sp. CA-293567]WBQ05801.1 alpha/beta hydrolase [Kribbella sp. CA-293567]
MPDDLYSDVLDEQLVRPDGRTVAWTRTGEGTPVLRLPGTPGSRWSVRADRSIWVERGLQVINTERPGFGDSTRLPGRKFREHSDDLAAILDHLGLDRVYLTGGSGGAPHVLAFAAHHPDRVVAATVMVGLPPLEDDEYEQMIPFNTTAFRSARDGDEEALREQLAAAYEVVKTAPLAPLDTAMATAPASDLAIMSDPVWRAGQERAMVAAFAQGMDGWLDEMLAMGGEWTDIDLTAISTSLTWWHGSTDRNCPFSAAERLVKQLPTATLRELGAGHFEPYNREGEILDELLARGR